MPGYSPGIFVKGPVTEVKKYPYYLRVLENGSININLLPLGEKIKSTAVQFSANQIVRIPSAALKNRKSMILYPIIEDGTFYVGGKDISISNGFPLESGTYFMIDLSDDKDLWGVSNKGGQVRILEVS